MSLPGVRLRRSILFTPGTRGDRIEKAITARAADVVVADLEDAVPPAEKEAARQNVRQALDATQGGSGAPERWVRINTWRSEWAPADLAAVIPARPHAIVVPKAGPRADLVALDVTLTRLERAAGLPVRSVRLVPIIETALGVARVDVVVQQPRVTAVAFGAEDLAADMGLRRTPSSTEVLVPRARVALVAGAARVDALDQVFIDIADTEALETEAAFARTLGYRGKMVIHPQQVAPVHRAFSPSPEEIEAARRLVDAVESADIGRGGVVRFEGRMVDVPLIEQARRVLAEAELAERHRSN